MIRKLIRNFLKTRGYDIIKTYDVDASGKIKILPFLRFKTVLDIGANQGQFLTEIFKSYPDLSFVSFEPLKEPYQKLLAFAKDKKNITTFNVALGNEDKEATIYRNQYTPSSSLLKMNQSHKDAFPYTQNAVEETIRIRRLDDVVKENPALFNGPFLMKIDVQGFEEQVLKGACDFLKKVDSIIIELNFEQLYENAPLFDDIYTLLKKEGFRYCGSIDQMKDPRTGAFLQADGLFKRMS